MNKQNSQQISTIQAWSSYRYLINLILNLISMITHMNLETRELYTPAVGFTVKLFLCLYSFWILSPKLLMDNDTGLNTLQKWIYMWLNNLTLWILHQWIFYMYLFSIYVILLTFFYQIKQVTRSHWLEHLSMSCTTVSHQDVSTGIML